jgi:16S rRNA (cytidine1402-2'-O)-methyltransferase
MIIYEAPHHLLKTLNDLLNTLGDRRITVCRELTKKHETVFLTTLVEAIEHYTANEPKGECVLVIEGKTFTEIAQNSIDEWNKLPLEEHMQLYLDRGMDKKEAMKAVAKDRGVSKQDIYKQLL